MVTEAETSKAERQPDVDKATILLVTGSLDHAMLAFEVAVGMQAMGTQVNMWFILQGLNCLKKPRSRFALSRIASLFKRLGGETGRNTRTDTVWQRVLQMLNYDGAEHLPLSQLNYFGAGPLVLSRIMKNKGMASLTDLIHAAEELGVKFKICQICVDALACDLGRDLVVEASVSGVSAYTLDVKNSHYNAVF